MPKFLAMVDGPTGPINVPGRFATRNRAHAAARRVAHVHGFAFDTFETVVAPAPTVAELVAAAVAGILFVAAAAARARLQTAAPINASDARLAFARLGMDLRLTADGEFRVNYRHGAEATAAYESDLPSAIDTGLAMLRCKARLSAELRTMGIPSAVADVQAVAALSL